MLVLKHFFCFLLLFFFKLQSKIRVRAIHGHALNTGKYGDASVNSSCAQPPSSRANHREFSFFFRMDSKFRGRGGEDESRGQ